MPAKRGASSGASIARAAERAVDVEPELFLARDCRPSAARSSIAPTSTVPAVPTSRNGVAAPLRDPRRSPHATPRYPSDARASVAIMRSAALPKPASSMAWRDAAMRRGRDIGGEALARRGEPSRRDAGPSARGARDQHGDEIRHRTAGDEQPAGASRESRTAAATQRGPGARPRSACDRGRRRLAFRPAASISASMPTGVPPPCTQPMKPGCALPAA